MRDARITSLADSVFDKLEFDILSGKYPIGAPLTELSLSKELEVSRTPIREAIRRLEQENLVEETPKGHVVTGVSYSDVRDAFFVRMRLEGEATARFAVSASDEDLSRMREVIEIQEFYTSRGESDKIRGADTEFHEIIYSGCGSKIIGSILTDLHRRVQQVRKLSVSDRMRAELAVREHREIYTAILRRDAEEAKKQATGHVALAMANIEKQIAAARGEHKEKT